ncbi:MAG TPA: SprT family zinc-dependent metalloprotease [Acetivibrio clariflavus]|mgnify:CR=1 FL=1|nr:SprT family zinc-dependent metalloprotease [Acetivibrio clariflavus]
MQNFIEIGNKKINYTIVKSSRKTIGISVSLKDGVKVSAPKKIGKKQISEIVNAKAAWILKKLSYFENIKAEIPELKFTEGEKFLVLGKEYRLKINKSSSVNSAYIMLSGNYLIVNLPENITGSLSDSVRIYITDWYKNYAKEVVSERINYFAKKMDVKPTDIIIKDLKSIWGSCTPKNTININWKIIMAPLDIVDYLVVHELTHIKIKNHSKQFWNMAESIYPNYKACSKWLKQNGHKLTF